MFDNLPQLANKNIAVHLHAAAERALKNGHPWLFDKGIRQQSHDGQAGDRAIIFDRKNRFLAAGLYDPASPIRVKVLQHRTQAKIGYDLFLERLQQAAAIRAPLAASNTNAYRLVYGESDYLPGLIIDRYADTLVLKIYTAAWFAHLRELVAALDVVQSAERLVLRLSRAVQAQETYGLVDGQVLRGDPITDALTFTENRLRFAADVIHGHKTGFFFDQRDNRARVAHLAHDKRVLDVFAYNGGFSVYAASGGAKSVLSLDISAPALASAQQNMRRNPQFNVPHDILVADAFTGLQDLANQGQRFDLVIVDPPSFAKKQDEVNGARQAYKRLTHLALDVLERGGVLVMASCSSRVPAQEFFAMIEHSATQAGRRLSIIDKTTHALDHPIIPTFPEGQYLKCLYART